MLEADIEDEIIEYVESIGGYALKLKIEGQRGWPDRTLLLPNGRIIFVEIKRPKKSHTYHMQKIWVKRLKALGFLVSIVKSLEEVKQLCER